MTYLEYAQALINHNWYYTHSECREVQSKGYAEEEALGVYTVDPAAEAMYQQCWEAVKADVAGLGYLTPFPTIEDLKETMLIMGVIQRETIPR